jgi:hypothetical protein
MAGNRIMSLTPAELREKRCKLALVILNEVGLKPTQELPDGRTVSERVDAELDAPAHPQYPNAIMDAVNGAHAAAMGTDEGIGAARKARVAATLDLDGRRAGWDPRVTGAPAYAIAHDRGDGGEFPGPFVGPHWSLTAMMGADPEPRQGRHVLVELSLDGSVTEMFERLPGDAEGEWREVERWPYASRTAGPEAAPAKATSAAPAPTPG